MAQFVISPSLINHCCSISGIDDFTKSLAHFYLENSLKLVLDQENTLVDIYENKFGDNAKFRSWLDILLGTTHRNIIKYTCTENSSEEMLLIELAGMILEEEKNLCSYDLSEFSSNIDRCRALGLSLKDNEGLKEKIRQLTASTIIVNQNANGEGSTNVYNE
jgi:hypothetical protein